VGRALGCVVFYVINYSLRIYFLKTEEHFYKIVDYNRSNGSTVKTANTNGWEEAAFYRWSRRIWLLTEIIGSREKEVNGAKTGCIYLDFNRFNSFNGRKEQFGEVGF
jgi:hypothetical protein